MNSKTIRIKRPELIEPFTIVKRQSGEKEVGEHIMKTALLKKPAMLFARRVIKRLR